jgi:hypothetical protein
MNCFVCEQTRVERLLNRSEETEEREYIMGGVSEMVAALAALGIMRAWEARQEDRKLRQEETFVPFHLPPLPQQEKSIPQPVIEARIDIDLAASSTHALSTP